MYRQTDILIKHARGCTVLCVLCAEKYIIFQKEVKQNADI